MKKTINTDKAEGARRMVRLSIERRRAAGETLEEIALDIGVHWVTVWKWQNGKISDPALRLLNLVLSDQPEVKSKPHKPSVATP